MKILITGGAGFIGSAVARYILEQTADAVLVVDKLTYAANPATINALTHHPHFKFIQADITDVAMVNSILTTYQPDAIMHLAAESHVDKSIDAPGDFIQTNIVGTYQLLTAALSYYNSLSLTKRSHFRFHHVSTDEVYGELTDSTSQFTECTAYAPSSPYSASKASADHLVRAWYRTFGLPIIITNSANNYGPYQFPEKLIPLTITRALKGLSLPIYGKGDQVRDWIYVDDHAKALYTALCQGRIGETYNIGANCEQKNRDVVKRICLILDEIKPAKFEHITHYMQLITSVEDRPGHDKRYAVSTDKIEHELGWRADQKFDDGLYKTIIWYLNNQTWWQSIIDGSYRAIAIDTGSYLD